MLEHGEELNLRMLQPLDTNTTVGVLRESGYLVPLNKWSKARQDYKGNTDRWVFNIIACAFIGLMVACLEMWSTRNIPIKLPKYTPVAVFLLGFAFGWVQLLGTSDRRKKVFRPKPDNPVQMLESTFDVHVAGDSDTSLFDKTGYKKLLLRVDETHYTQATLFVWEESYDLKEERTWPLVSIALFDEDGKPVKLQSVESKKEVKSVER